MKNEELRFEHDSGLKEAQAWLVNRPHKFLFTRPCSRFAAQRSSFCILRSLFFILNFLSVSLCLCGSVFSQTPLRIGSKTFTENVILGELATQLARSAGADATHVKELGSTRILWTSLVKGDLDIYPDYTGTIREEIFAGRELADAEAVKAALAEHGVLMSRPLGFSNTYAIGMKREAAERLGLADISGLRRHPELKFGFSTEFIDRHDGWKGLQTHYQLPQQDVRGLDHDLAYRGLESGAIHATDLYSTDAKIRLYDLTALKDDLAFFPDYEAVYLYRRDLRERSPGVVSSLLRLENGIPETEMIDMNAQAEIDRLPESQVAARYLTDRLGIGSQVESESVVQEFLRLTGQHMYLVGVSLALAIVAAVPLGVWAAGQPRVGQIILAVVGVVQTIPSIALLVFMIPLLNLGAKPAIAALFVYSLLPIVRNTFSGLKDIPLTIRESARALGLPPLARLRLIELPMAARTIAAGIKTAAVINVGTATLGGLIGAGGYGQLIFRGIRKDDLALLLQGAIPAALLALGVQGLFELAERFIVPKGLRLKEAA